MEKQKLPLIQLLRGFAALLVLFHHGSGIGTEYLQGQYLNNIFSAGWIGVDIFFVLSGFIIFYVHHSDFGRRDRLKKFYLKRSIRVYPVYWIVAAVLIALFTVMPSWGEGYETKTDVIIKSLLLFPQDDSRVMGVAWTLEREIFFYLIFSALIFLKPKFSIVLGSAWIAGIVLSATGIFNDMNFALNFIFDSYNLEFILGSVVAYLVLKFKFKQHLIYLYAGIAGFAISWYLILQGVLVKFDVSSNIALGFSCALIVLGVASADINRRSHIPRGSVLIGDASYSIYLTHYYVLLFIFKLVQGSGLSIGNTFMISIAIIVAGALGILFHLLIEKPLLNFITTRFFVKRKPKIKLEAGLTP